MALAECRNKSGIFHRRQYNYFVGVSSEKIITFQ
jgi:hypothetical protein